MLATPQVCRGDHAYITSTRPGRILFRNPFWEALYLFSPFQVGGVDDPVFFERLFVRNGHQDACTVFIDSADRLQAIVYHEKERFGRLAHSRIGSTYPHIKLAPHILVANAVIATIQNPLGILEYRASAVIPMASVTTWADKVIRSRRTKKCMQLGVS